MPQLLQTQHGFGPLNLAGSHSLRVQLGPASSVRLSGESHEHHGVAAFSLRETLVEAGQQYSRGPAIFGIPRGGLPIRRAHDNAFVAASLEATDNIRRLRPAHRLLGKRRSVTTCLHKELLQPCMALFITEGDILHPVQNNIAGDGSVLELLRRNARVQEKNHKSEY